MHRRIGRIWVVAAARRGLIIGLLPTLVLGALLAPPAGSADQATIAANVGATPSGQPMGQGFVGVSLEFRAVHVYTGRDPDAVNPLLVRLLRALAPGQSPSVRIGGNSTDATWWPITGVIPPAGVNYSLSQGWFRTTRALARALKAQLILGVNLASGRPGLAVAEAHAILAGIGRRYVQALELGNEADVYNEFAWYRDRRGRVVFARPQTYSLEAFINEFSHWRAAIPTAPLAGPAFASTNWMGGLSSFLDAEPGLRLVTFHRYPLRGCIDDPTSPFYGSITNLFTDQASTGLAQAIAPYVAVAHARGVPFRLDELNSAACSGRVGVSNTFASALWALDTLFNLAAVGVDGVNIHTLPGAAYQPFTFSRVKRVWRAMVHPIYYGLLMFAEAFPPGAQLLPVTVPGGPVKVWATQAPDGKTRVVLINKNRSSPALVQLHLPGPQTAATALSLLAPNARAITGVTIGGQAFGADTRTARLAGAPRIAVVVPGASVYSVRLPAASALLLTR